MYFRHAPAPSTNTSKKTALSEVLFRMAHLLLGPPWEPQRYSRAESRSNVEPPWGSPHIVATAPGPAVRCGQPRLLGVPFGAPDRPKPIIRPVPDFSATWAA